jgi:flagellar protein FliS
MQQNPRDAYLEAEVRTATPQRLRLMLIDGALRFARRALDTWGDEQQGAESYEALARCRSIVAELAGSIRADQPLAKQVQDIQLFLFRQLAEAPAHNDPERLKGVVEVLEVERETWRKLCEQMPEAPVNEEPVQEITASDMPAIMTRPGEDPGPGTLSLEA